MPVIRYWKCGKCGAHLDELESMVDLTPLCHNDERDCYSTASVFTDMRTGKVLDIDFFPMLKVVFKMDEFGRYSVDTISKNPDLWLDEPDWTQEDEDLYHEWAEMDFRWEEFHRYSA